MPTRPYLSKEPRTFRAISSAVIGTDSGLVLLAKSPARRRVSGGSGRLCSREFCPSGAVGGRVFKAIFTAKNVRSWSFSTPRIPKKGAGGKSRPVVCAKPAGRGRSHKVCLAASFMRAGEPAPTMTTFAPPSGICLSAPVCSSRPPVGLPPNAWVLLGPPALSSARLPAGHHAVTAPLKARIEALEAELAKVEAGGRADFERERFDWLMLELLPATIA